MHLCRALKRQYGKYGVQSIYKVFSRHHQTILILRVIFSAAYFNYVTLIKLQCILYALFRFTTKDLNVANDVHNIYCSL